MKKRWIALGLFSGLFAGGFGLWANANREIAEAQPIKGASDGHVIWDATFKPGPVDGTVNANPFLAAATNGTMHGDGGQSDTHLAAGPFGAKVEVRSRRSGNGLPRQCSTFVYRTDGKPVIMCGGLSGFRMVLLDPDTLQALAHYDLPVRPSSFEAFVKRDMGIMMTDSSGGAYMFLDNHDRLVFADSQWVVQRLKASQSGGEWSFEVERQWDLKPYVPHDCFNWNNWFPQQECDKITTVMPDHEGRYWWTTRNGRLGTLDPDSGKVSVIKLNGEEIQNALTMDARAIYVLSDRAQYAFTANALGKPVQLWRTGYDRGTKRKIGSINQGSGTTPTLVGDKWITFADNADGRINIVVLRRSDGSRVCAVPIFKLGASATDNSMIGWGRSIILENNAGFTSAHQQKDWSAVAGGVVRVDVRADESGCDTVWTSPLKSPSVVPKLSASSGIAYFYSFDLVTDAQGKPTQDWSIVGLDFKTGKQVIKIPTGQGKPFDNNWASMSIAPNGDFYAGMTGGLVQVRSR
ncbi:MAG: hypothetical protein WBO17_01500 [Sphingorhabdus sp.]